MVVYVWFVWVWMQLGNVDVDQFFLYFDLYYVGCVELVGWVQQGNVVFGDWQLGKYGVVVVQVLVGWVGGDEVVVVVQVCGQLVGWVVVLVLQYLLYCDYIWLQGFQ